MFMQNFDITVKNFLILLKKFSVHFFNVFFLFVSDISHCKLSRFKITKMLVKTVSLIILNTVLCH